MGTYSHTAAASSLWEVQSEIPQRSDLDQGMEEKHYLPHGGGGLACALNVCVCTIHAKEIIPLRAILGQEICVCGGWKQDLFSSLNQSLDVNWGPEAVPN